MIIPKSGSSPIQKTWHEARSQCLSLGGDLSSVRDQLENERIVALLDENGIDWQALIGGNDERIEGQFGWSDGKPFLFSNWYPGEPNNDYGNEDCINMYMSRFKGTWNDKPCDYKLPFICKFRM